MSLFLTQQEANDLLALEKHSDDAQSYEFPGLGGSLRIPLYSADHREEFSLDITRGYIALNNLINNDHKLNFMLKYYQ